MTETPEPLPAPRTFAARGFVVPPDVVTLPVAVDVREERSGLPDRLRGHGLAVDVCSLDVGDVAIGERILVERKTAIDLLLSIRQGRLFRQAYELKRRARPLLVVEGDPYELVHHEDARAVRGAVLSLLVGYRIPVLQTGSLEESAACIVHLALQEDRRARRNRRRREGELVPGEVRALLEACPQVGPARARALVEAFGSVRDVALADVAAITRVPGIGPMTAARLLDALSKRPE